uniref:Helitron helicase-like domain-containing protein n=1 Tax=Ananas comosus var. bracteatus TaxID=296719 RepID=A0A6V7PHJ3_ANACO|nr:unnamed protein product [Ananas comosus var. bracteatus]
MHVNIVVLYVGTKKEFTKHGMKQCLDFPYVVKKMKAINPVDELQNIDRNIVHSLIEMFDSENEIVKAFRMARDRFRKSDCLPIRLRLIGSRIENTSQYNPPSCSEIAGLIVGDLGSADRHRDIVVEHKTQGLKRISDLHPSFMAMQYHILFPYGEDGFRIDIKYNGTTGKKVGTRKCVTMREFYAYRIQNRIAEGDVDGNAIGKKIILPSIFTAGPRYMMQNYQDAIAICRHCGHPDLFITFTCNTQWLEIENALRFISGQKAEDRPDIVSRVFKMKVEALMADIKSGVYFGKVVADLYTVEFQKRGLPHVHILVWLDASHKSPSSTEIDSIISAEIPDKTIDHVGYEAVSKFMVHGPCGLANSKAPCMAKGRCSKYFSKEFRTETMMDENGFAIYRRKLMVKCKILRNGYISLKDLTLTQQHAKIKIRVSRIWESTTPQLKKDILSLDCLLIDEEGYAMQATIRKHDATTFRALLSEGNAYIIENFNVIPSRNTYKVVDRRYMIQISKWTQCISFYFLIQNSKYTCKAKLATIDTTYGWWYKACYDCKGAVKDYNDSFWCSQCGKNDQAPIPWYKLNAIIEDETGSANFTIFGKLAQDLIHAPAHQLATAINSDRNVLPTAIKKFLGQTYIFQVLADSRKLNIGVPSFRVAKIFAPDLDTKGKGKQVSTNTEIIEEVTDTTAIATESHYGLDEIHLM